VAQVIVRHLDDNVKAALKRRASQHGWSTEEEVRQILRRAVDEEQYASVKLGSRIAARFARLGAKARTATKAGLSAGASATDEARAAAAAACVTKVEMRLNCDR
jgi:plasmid stability protein